MEMNTDKVGKVHGNILAGPGDQVRDHIRAMSEHAKCDISVLNVADDYKEFHHHRDVLYVHAGLNDGNPDWSLPYGEPNSVMSYFHAVIMLDRLVDISDVVYIHCHGGVSRTGIVLSLYFAWVYNISPEEAAERIKRVYSRINVHPKHWEVAPEVMKRLANIPLTLSLYWRKEGMIGE